jgi:putative hydrolase of the HAD superfamily
MPQFSPGQTLLIDADDTLWENNIYFERAIAAFIAYLDHQKHTPAEVRKTLNAVERETILSHGYGLGSFTHSLVACFERLSPAPVTEEKAQRILGFARAIAEQEIELLPGVQQTLAELATRHRLILMTKGNHAEQADKFARSGVANHFSAVEIVQEKDPPAYRAAYKLDDRQQPQKRHQPRPRRRPPRRLPLPQRHLGAGARHRRSGSGRAALGRTRFLRQALHHLLVPLPSPLSAPARAKRPLPTFGLPRASLRVNWIHGGDSA